jgi:hypothetical protein
MLGFCFNIYLVYRAAPIYRLIVEKEISVGFPS